MNSDEIQRLVKIVEQADIAELEVSGWGRKVRILKYPARIDPSSQNAALHYALPQAPPPAPPVGSNSETAEAAAKESTPAASGEEFRSPMVGTFYRAPAPDADPYVKIGDTVKEGQVLCIIEAMKLMNEVEAEFACKVVEILVENAQPVEYNQPLFVVERL